MTPERSELYKEGKVFFSTRAEHEVAEIEILVDGGPLCVAPVWDWDKNERLQGLFFVYFKSHGLHFGPFYADIGLASIAMRKALKAFPQPDFWKQTLDWYKRQTAFQGWIEKNMGKPKDLVGGEWLPEESSSRKR